MSDSYVEPEVGDLCAWRWLVDSAIDETFFAVFVGYGEESSYFFTSDVDSTNIHVIQTRKLCISDCIDNGVLDFRIVSKLCDSNG